MPRRWFKIWIEEWETGSIRVDMDSAERGFWLDMISKSLKGRVEGKICRDSKGEVGYTNEELAQGAHVPLSLVESTIAKRLKDKSIIIHPNHVIEIVNIWKFQSKLEKEENGRKPRKTKTDLEKTTDKAYFVSNTLREAIERAKEVDPDLTERELNELCRPDIKDLRKIQQDNEKKGSE